MQSCEYTLHVKCLWPNFNLMLINNKGDIIPDLQAFERSSLDEFFFFFFTLDWMHNLWVALSLGNYVFQDPLDWVGSCRIFESWYRFSSLFVTERKIDSSFCRSHACYNFVDPYSLYSYTGCAPLVSYYYYYSFSLSTLALLHGRDLKKRHGISQLLSLYGSLSCGSLVDRRNLILINPMRGWDIKAWKHIENSIVSCSVVLFLKQKQMPFFND